MANPDHHAILRKGVEAWNKWRERNPKIKPDLSRTVFIKANLSRANLSRANLSEANLRVANLSEANLDKANLLGADLSGGNLRGANLYRANLREASLREAILREANLDKANLFGADLRGGNLRGANLYRANASEADLRGADLCAASLVSANLREAILDRANFFRADLRGADLCVASLVRADLREADLSGADLTGVILAGSDGTGANLGGAKLTRVQFTTRDTGEPVGSFLDLATADGLELADFGDPGILPWYLAEAFDYAHQPDLEEMKRYPQLVDQVVANIKALRRLYGTQEAMPAEVVEIVRTITAELIEYLQRHPKAMYTIKPRQFEELIGEILSSYGWQVMLTPASKDGGYDLYAIVQNAPGAPTSWIIECKKYAPERKVGVDIVQRLWGIKLDLRVANAMLATTSYFTQGAQAFKSSRYDLALRDYEGILEWINEYRPHPDGKLYIRDHHIVLPGEKPPKAGP